MNLGSEVTTLIISNEEVNDIMKIIKSFEKSWLFIKDVCGTINKKKKNKRNKDFFSMLLGTLGASLLGNL